MLRLIYNKLIQKNDNNTNKVVNMCKRLQPLKFIKEIRNSKNYTVEMKANTILSGCGIEESPIDIEKIANTIGFKLYSTNTFKSDKYSAFLTDSDHEIRDFGTGSLIVVRSSDTTEIKRYWQTICLCYYILQGNENENISATFKYIENNNLGDNIKELILARALLMPQRDLSMYVNSPLQRNIKGQDLVKNIAHAFIVPEEIVQLRLSEAGFEI